MYLFTELFMFIFLIIIQKIFILYFSEENTDSTTFQTERILAVY